MRLLIILMLFTGVVKASTFDDLKGEECVTWQLILCGPGRLPENVDEWTKEDDKLALCRLYAQVKCYKK